jgi:hypothetical protein
VPNHPPPEQRPTLGISATKLWVGNVPPKLSEQDVLEDCTSNRASDKHVPVIFNHTHVLNFSLCRSAINVLAAIA